MTAHPCIAAQTRRICTTSLRRASPFKSTRTQPLCSVSTTPLWWATHLKSTSTHTQITHHAQVRDERGAREDLAAHGTALKRRALTATLSGTPLPQPFATLMFSCNGRGTNLYSEPSYDARTVASYLPVPISGFLANGEIGKVGCQSLLVLLIL